MLAEARTYAEDAWKRSPEEGGPKYIRALMWRREIDAALAILAKLDRKDSAVAEIERRSGAVLFKPEEKVKFAAAIATQPTKIELAAAAGLVDGASEVARRSDDGGSPDGNDAKEQKQKLTQLQQSRMRFDELGAQLEAYDAALTAESRSDELTEAALAYRSSGNTAAELRVLQIAEHGAAPLEAAAARTIFEAL